MTRVVFHLNGCILVLSCPMSKLQSRVFSLEFSFDGRAFAELKFLFMCDSYSNGIFLIGHDDQIAEGLSLVVLMFNCHSSLDLFIQV